MIRKSSVFELNIEMFEFFKMKPKDSDIDSKEIKSHEKCIHCIEQTNKIKEQRDEKNIE